MIRLRRLSQFDSPGLFRALTPHHSDQNLNWARNEANGVPSVVPSLALLTQPLPSLSFPISTTMDEVLPGLWIGDLACALSPEYLSIAGITHIITALGQRLPAPKSPLPCGRTIPASRCYHVKCDDEESENLLVHFPRVNEVINEALQEQWVKGEQGGEIDEWKEATHEWGHWETTGEGTVLVHCQAGCSRSVALVVAYVMATRGIGRDAALELIRARRSQAEPNEGFMEQ